MSRLFLDGDLPAFWVGSVTRDIKWPFCFVQPRDDFQTLVVFTALWFLGVLKRDSLPVSLSGV